VGTLIGRYIFYFHSANDIWKIQRTIFNWLINLTVRTALVWYVYVQEAQRLILCSVDYTGLLIPCCNSVNKSNLRTSVYVYSYSDITKPGSFFFKEI